MNITDIRKTFPQGTRVQMKNSGPRPAIGTVVGIEYAMLGGSYFVEVAWDATPEFPQFVGGYAADRLDVVR